MKKVAETDSTEAFLAEPFKTQRKKVRERQIENLQ